MERKDRHHAIRERKELFPFFRRDGELKERLTVLVVVLSATLSTLGIGTYGVHKIVEIFEKEAQQQEALAAALQSNPLSSTPDTTK